MISFLLVDTAVKLAKEFAENNPNDVQKHIKFVGTPLETPKKVAEAIVGMVFLEEQYGIVLDSPFANSIAVRLLDQ